MNDLIQNFIPKVEKEIAEIVGITKGAYIADISNYIISSGGKRLRAIFPYLFGKMIGEDEKKLISLGAVCEMLHMATLLHDDVVDVAYLRRGKPSTNVVWGNKTSILCGDYLFSSALQELVKIGAVNLYSLFSDTIKKLSVGELLHLKKNELIGEEEYNKIIGLKTASLFTCAASCPAYLDSKINYAKDLALFGYHFGMLFQIQDDLIDYFVPKEKSGKPEFSDLKNGVVTLPIIKLVALSSSAEQKSLREIMTLDNKDKEQIEFVLKLLEKYRVKEKISNDDFGFHFNECKEALKTYPSSVYKDKLSEILAQAKIF